MLQNYFDKFGHKCTLNLDNPFDDVKANKNWLQLWIMKHKIINPELILLRSRPRSCHILRKEMLCQLKKFPCILHPFSTITFVCEVVWMLVTFMFLIELPFNVIKYSNPEKFWQNHPKYFEVTMNSICVFDFIRRFFTGYLIQHNDRDEVVFDFKRIFIQYLKFYLLIDLLSTLPSFVEFQFREFPNTVLVLEIFTYLKLFRLPGMLRVLKNVMQFYQINHNFSSIFNSLLKLAFTVHWLACFSILVGVIEQRFDPTMYQWYHLIDKRLSLFNVYITCLHRTTSILTGIGFNFFQHNIEGEKLISVTCMVYIMFTAVLGRILTLIIFGETCQKVQGMRSSEAKYEDMLNEVSEYMKHEFLPETTQNKIKTYYAYKYEHSYFNENEILTSIPNVLRENILLHCAKLLLENTDFLNKLPAPLVANLVSHLGKEIVVGGDVIYYCFDKGNTLYFLISGTVASFTCDGREFMHQEDGSYFGQSCLIFNNIDNTRVITKIAIETCELFALESSEFIAFKDYCPDLVDQMEREAFENLEVAVLTQDRYENLLTKELLRRERSDMRLPALI